MGFRNIARVEDIPPGKTKYFHLDIGPVVLANVAGEIFALSGVCSHQKNPLDGATLIDYLIDCPWHHFQYDVRTGRNHFPRNVFPADVPRAQAQLAPVSTYAVEIRNDEIWVDIR